MRSRWVSRLPASSSARSAGAAKTPIFGQFECSGNCQGLFSHHRPRKEDGSWFGDDFQAAHQLRLFRFLAGVLETDGLNLHQQLFGEGSSSEQANENRNQDSAAHLGILRIEAGRIWMNCRASRWTRPAVRKSRLQAESQYLLRSNY